MFAYCNNSPVVFADKSGSTCQRTIADVYGGYVFSANEAAGGGAGTILLLDLLYKLWENNNSKAKSSAKSNKASDTAGGVASPKPPKKGNSSPNYDGGTLYNKSGVRIDYEYYGNGNGNVHLHKNGTKYYYDSINNTLRTTTSISSAPAPSAIQKLLYDPQIQKALTRGIEIIQSLGGM